MRPLFVLPLVIVGLPVALATLFLIVNSVPPAARSRRFITDRHGRALVLHGLNVNAGGKSAPLRVDSTSREDPRRMAAEWGFSVVRFLVFWDGMEPERGVYDEAYLDRVAERVRWCEEAGLRVILDMHQDLYAVRWGEDGAPPWAAVEDDGFPVVLQAQWERTYLQLGVRTAFDNFRDPARVHADLGESFIRAFVHLGERFRGGPAVLGYDLNNEPFYGTLRYFRFERAYLGPFYQRLIDAIRTAGRDMRIVVEPMAAGVNQGFRSRLPPPSRPAAGEPRLAYFPHLHTLELRDREGVRGSTEIALPVRRIYPEGFVVRSSDPEGSWSWVWDAGRQVLSVSTPRDGRLHRITIQAARGADDRVSV